MPVYGCSIVSQMILNCDFNPVTPTSLDPGSWVLPVEDFASIWPVDAVRIDVLISYIQVILCNVQSVSGS